MMTVIQKIYHNCLELWYTQKNSYAIKDKI